MIKKILGFKDRNSFINFSLEKIETAMYEMGFNRDFVEEIITPLEKRVSKYGENEFQEWFNELNYRLPGEFKDELFATKIYENHKLLIEEEVINLEKETKLPWKIQAKDLKDINEKARKVQLVIRHRLSDIALDMLN
ncbi:hypothetical protein CEY16_11525 [Halalkalibacillus sediminis]|uniref:Uncharacterized protein n=1 Tax=Halalkalibacillus sediminis TaxID=2018042 RepID=A0A2I0QSM4_9BACI|nr:hypothetical protein [Halalkalibacillus sediminis]PKR77355.1 hypothetical protein CEY16_11525 [Halalkalibacillus sediminis]